MIIIGIDPGYDRLGVAVIEKMPLKKDVVIFSECLQTSVKDSIYERLCQIGSEISRVLDQFKPDVMAIETLFITKNQKTAMRVAEARGVIVYEASKRGMPIFEYSPVQIKSAVTGDGRGDKTMVTKMVRLLVKLPDKKIIDDEYDAIAIALTHSACAQSKKTFAS